MPINTLDFKNKIIGKIKKKFEVKEKAGKHIFYTIYHKGERVGKTFCSHGSGGKEINDRILSKIKNQLHLGNFQQLYNLRDCPMTAEDYFNLLKQKNVISD